MKAGCNTCCSCIDRAKHNRHLTLVMIIGYSFHASMDILIHLAVDVECCLSRAEVSKLVCLRFLESRREERD